MSRFKKEVAAVIANQDVRDPRAALLAIEKLLTAKIAGPKKGALVLRVDVIEGPNPGEIETVIKHPANHYVAARALLLVDRAIREFAAEKLSEIKAGEKSDV